MKNGGFSTFDKLYLYSVESWLAYYILKINLKLILANKKRHHLQCVQMLITLLQPFG